VGRSRVHEETYEATDFDPTTYLVALDEATGEYVGIARVWMKRPMPRLGFIGVLTSFRRRGIARALLAEVFARLDERGFLEVTTEIDETNTASRTLLEGLGARRTGTSVELIRRYSSSIQSSGTFPNAGPARSDRCSGDIPERWPSGGSSSPAAG
jgi:ribosomal protein S18 acetylase RimI-like enzyme